MNDKLESVSEKLLKREQTILTEMQARIAVMHEQVKNMPNCTLRNQMKRWLKKKQEVMQDQTNMIRQVAKYAK